MTTEKRHREATSVYVKAAKLAKLSDPLDGEIAAELEEIYGRNSCNARRWIRDAAEFGAGGQDIRGDLAQGNGEGRRVSLF